MSVIAPSFAKINVGLRIGTLGSNGFHELRTVYQTVALHDTICVSIGRGSGIEIRCDDPRVPTDPTNTCFKIAEHAMTAMKARARVVIQIEKHLPVQGGLGGASGNAVTALLALERALRRTLTPAERLRIAAQVGSDLPLFLIAGTVLGVGRGEEVYPLPDLPGMPCVIALPEIAVSTPKAFADWDELCGAGAPARELPPGVPTSRATAPEVGIAELRSARTGGGARPHMASSDSNQVSIDKLKNSAPSDRMAEFSREISSWLSAGPMGRRRSGVSAKAAIKSGGRAENPLLDLVRTGIENDFEKVVFPQYPELREVKGVLERAGALYASLSGSGSAVYGLFDSRERASMAAKKLNASRVPAVITSTLTRRQYWNKLLAISS